MVSKFILTLNDPGATLAHVGGKGASLAVLAGAGFPVPDGFHITTAAYRQFVKINNLQKPINNALKMADVNHPSTLAAASTEIGKLFAQAKIPNEISEEVSKAYSGLQGTDPAVAVRSSATAEDLPDASFAGQQETYLNVIGTRQVTAAVKECWKSLWTPRAIGYRTRHSIPTESLALAVVVQLLVDAEAAGILFTVNPINGNSDEAVINAAWGLGEAVVGGNVSPDTLTVSKKEKRILNRMTAEKKMMTLRSDSGTQNQPVPDFQQNVPVLSDKQAIQLAQLGNEIQELYGKPMDIEWALKDGKFSILQARQITTLPEAPVEWLPPDPKGVYMRTSVVDLAPKPLSPLYVTLGIPAQVAQMQPLGKRLTGLEPVLASDYFTTINNYAFMNATFPPKAIWWILFGLVPAYFKIFMNKLPKIWREELLPEYQASVDNKQKKDAQQMTSAEIWQDIQDLVNAACYYTCGLMFATMGASAGSEGLLTIVYNKLVKKEGDPDATALLMGWNNIAVRSEKSLFDLALWIKKNEALKQYFLDTPSEVLAARLSLSKKNNKQVKNGDKQWEEFKTRFQTHLEKFGHSVFQLDFVEKLPRDNPEMLLENIRMYLNDKGNDPYKRQENSEKKRIQTTETMLKRVKGIKSWVFRWALNWGQSMAEIREDALAEIGLAYPRIRELLSELGHRLEEASVIKEDTDIYWLEKDEITAAIAKLDAGKRPEFLTENTAERKTFHKRINQVTPPAMVPFKKRVMGIKTETFLAESGDNQDVNILKGVPTSAGKVTAPAQILHGPEDFDLMHPGDVLVAGTTTPAWTPLFAMASAVVTDIGGPLSHGSIVAREYGIPAVMGTGIATRRIQAGQMITVDGSAGTVELMQNHSDD